jgi:hypothetical protein
LCGNHLYRATRSTRTHVSARVQYCMAWNIVSGHKLHASYRGCRLRSTSAESDRCRVIRGREAYTRAICEQHCSTGTRTYLSRGQLEGEVDQPVTYDADNASAWCRHWCPLVGPHSAPPHAHTHSGGSTVGRVCATHDSTTRSTDHAMPVFTARLGHLGALRQLMSGAVSDYASCVVIVHEFHAPFVMLVVRYDVVSHLRLWVLPSMW